MNNKKDLSNNEEVQNSLYNEFCYIAKLEATP